eukprot:TRINITY_DN21085_c0_g1_i1.p1 TRINITY_DN21085_c0_g1~~TRINITY_DN21085_c0_g1_i1.p1  ORF type:complete len:1287 (-),score=515.73 TRINITY_DN21085_c0_g1_i1:63-3923(-)
MTKGLGRPNVPIGMAFAEDPELDPVDIGEGEIRSAYRMNLPSHMGITHNCKKNCRYNPRCLSALGEKVWLEADEEEESEAEVEDEMVRHDGVPAGLRNLGNTCYVNSFLQIWFHNSRFRKALYDWEPGEDPEEQDNESILDAELYEPRSKVASLQALFAMMQFTKRKFVDPADFICKLGLNPSVQQDAQEFSKLFVSLLEDSLAHQKQVSVRTMIQKQFRGEYAYVTTCQACLKESVRPSHFYELDLALAGNKTIADCLGDFLKVERMTGDEKYFCENCCSKQEATRCCKLRELPPVLNLQLNRFQFDMQLGRKKKLNSNIQFPEELDMSGYIATSSPAKYSLTGVLMHVGPDANHGHYIAHIQEMESGNWFKFSDECVAPLQGKSLRLGAEEEIGGQGRKQGKLGKIVSKAGVQNSNNAYMLVYMLQESIQEIRAAEAKEKVKRDTVYRQAMSRLNKTEPGQEKKSDRDQEYCYSNSRIFPTSFPPHLRTKIDRDNMEFDEEHEERMTSRLAEHHAARNKQKRMIDQYTGLKWDPEDIEEEDEEFDESYEFLPTLWLVRWLANPVTCGPIETRHLLCMHDSLDIDKLHEVKICDSAIVTTLYLENGEGEGPRLTHDRLCQICIMNKARLISLDFKMLRDQQFLASQKSPVDGTGFWVGKRSYARWRTLGKVALEDMIIVEVAQWKDQQARATQIEMERRKKFEERRKGWKVKEEEEEEDEKEGFCLTELQKKLQKMGTNVSIAPHDAVKNSQGNMAGISVIRNGESFKMANIAEVKLNFSEEEKKAWTGKVKPSCAVKPMLKAPKPSATVKPFLKSEGICEDDRLEKGEGKEVGGGGSVFISNGQPNIQSTTQQSSNSASCSESRSSSRSSSLDSLPSNKTSASEASSRETSGPETNAASPTPSLPSSVTHNMMPSEDDFNADILCPHGNLRIEQRARQLISRAAWYRLNTYFSRPITFQFGTPVCSVCEDQLNEANLQKERWREEAARQKARLPDLFKDTERPKWSKPSTTRVYLLSSSFVLAWRGFVRGLSAGKSDSVGESITDVNNRTLLCPHSGLLFMPTIAWEAEPNPALVMITEEEWLTVQDMFTVDVEIRVDRENLSSGPVLTSNPAPCTICVASRQEAEQEDRLKYTNSRVFVRRISPDEKVPVDSHEDPEYCDSPVFGGDPKRLKLMGGDYVRRSSRRVKVRGEREFIVNSDMMLRDFKVKLMEVFKVAPYDQNLMVNGEYLTENHLSLGQLKVLPGSLIFLRADEPASCAPSPSEDYVGQNHPEQGFKGTGLLSS